MKPDCDKDIRPVLVSKTCADSYSKDVIETDRFSHFKSWQRLVEVTAKLKHLARFHGTKDVISVPSVETFEDAKIFLFKSVQSEFYSEEIDSLQRHIALPKRSDISNLCPFLDERGVLRVGGRIDRSDISLQERKPIIIPGRHFMATLLVKDLHEKVKHQGRQFTEGTIRSSGFWIIGARRLISSVIQNCVTCRKLRGRFGEQVMSQLPRDRLEPSPPFTNVGVDAFGPWTIITRKTRGGSANSKRWAILFTCLVTRAVHIELVEEMSSSAFINAMKRFTSIRGKVKIFRSDRGTNFVGAVKELGIHAINVEDQHMASYLNDSGTVWIFNPPHSSHMGGVWERMIGITRRILDAILLEHGEQTLTHDVLNTLDTDGPIIFICK